MKNKLMKRVMTVMVTAALVVMPIHMNSRAEDTNSSSISATSQKEYKTKPGFLAWRIVSAEDKISLKETKWKVQEWDKASKSYKDMATQPKVNYYAKANKEYGMADGEYFATDWLTATEKNEGWFKVTETEAQKGYINNAVSFEASLLKESENHNLFVTANNNPVAINNVVLTNAPEVPKTDTNVSMPQIDLSQAEETKTGISVVENVNQDNKEYPVKAEGELSVAPRQFTKFVTTDGQVYYLVINHADAEGNVLLLREVSSADLKGIADSGNQALDPIVALGRQQANTEVTIQPQVSTKNNDTKSADAAVKTNWIKIAAGIAIVVAGGVYYVVSRKKKKHQAKTNKGNNEYHDDYDYDE